MKFSSNFIILYLLIFTVSLCFVSCKNQSVDIISFDAINITPGRAEQNKFTSYSLKFLNNEDSLIASSIKILYDDDIEIIPVKFNQASATTYIKSDTVYIAFTTQNKFIPNQSYTLIYNNTKKNKKKKLQQPQLKMNNNIPN